MQRPFLVENAEQDKLGEYLVDGWETEWVEEWSEAHDLFALLLESAIPQNFIGSNPLEMGVPDEAIDDLFDSFDDIFYWTLTDLNLYLLEYTYALIAGVDASEETVKELYEQYLDQCEEHGSEPASFEQYREGFDPAAITDGVEAYKTKFYQSSCYLERPEVGMELEFDDAVSNVGSTARVIGFSTDQPDDERSICHPDVLVETTAEETGSTVLARVDPHVFNAHATIV